MQHEFVIADVCFVVQKFSGGWGGGGGEAL